MPGSRYSPPYPSCLAAIFIVCFIGELKKTSKRGMEHNALMPLEDDTQPAPHTHNAETITDQQEKVQ